MIEKEVDDESFFLFFKTVNLEDDKDMDDEEAELL